MRCLIIQGLMNSKKEALDKKKGGRPLSLFVVNEV